MGSTLAAGIVGKLGLGAIREGVVSGGARMSCEVQAGRHNSNISIRRRISTDLTGWLVPLRRGDGIGFKASNSYVAGHFDSTGNFVQTPSTGISSPGGVWEVLQDPGAPGLVADLDSGAFRLAIEVLEPNGQLETFGNVPDMVSTAGLLGLGALRILQVASKRRPAKG